MSLLSKTNPRATVTSVVQHALIVAGIGATIYLVIMIWNDNLRDHWMLGLALWTILSGFVGGVWEWQVADEDVEEPDD